MTRRQLDDSKETPALTYIYDVIMSISSVYPSRSLAFLCFIALLACFSAGSASGADPTTYTLKGTVCDNESGEVLAGAHVFLLESTVGTITDDEGQFSLSGLQAGAYKIGISMIGFQAHSFQVDVASESEKVFHITLTPQVYELAQVTVTAKQNRRWRKQLGAFKLQVIGDSDNARQTHIVNPEVLDFNQQKDMLLAEAHAPLIIENRALGYRIYYTLVHCALQKDLPQYKGIARFEELEPENNKQRRRWKNNRKTAYKGSFKHLLRTLASKRDMKEIEEEGFHLALAPRFPKTVIAYDKAIQQSRESVHDLVQKSAYENENYLRIENYLLITFTDELESNRYVRNQLLYARDPDVQRSSIELREGSTIFHDKGFLYDAYSVVLHGYMGWERMADMLPIDYQPEL